MKNLTPLFMLVCLSATAQLRKENINGVITMSEQRDTTQARINKRSTANVLIKSDKESVYFGIHSDVLASVSIVLNKGDEFIVIHASGCSGRGIYKRVQDDSLQITQAFYDVRTNPEKWDVIGSFAHSIVFKKEKPLSQVQADMATCFNRWGYMTSTLDMGSYREVEVLLSKVVFKEYKVLVQNTVYTAGQGSPTKKEFFPSVVKATPAVIQKFLDGVPGTALSIGLKAEEWLVVDNL